MHAQISLRKTAIAASMAAAISMAAVLLSVAFLPAGSSLLVSIFAGTCTLAFAALVTACELTIRRQRHVDEGRRDWFLELNERRSEHALAAGTISWSLLRRRLARGLTSHEFMVGDLVRIKPLDQIRATCDAENRLAGLPFQQEMAKFCGQSAVVYRHVDKIYDYGKTKLMRGMERSVLLRGLRCNGSAHGGCQAACYFIWKTEWLEPAGFQDPAASGPGAVYQQLIPNANPAAVYSCQYTSLADASTPPHQFPLRNLLISLIGGNIRLQAFVLVLATAFANRMQQLRGGATYPSMPSPTAELTKPANLRLSVGQMVRVRTPAEIAKSLDVNSKNRGLWFDQDMLKYCGQVFPVKDRIDKIIDVNSGRMLAMKTPCIVLDDVHYSGEFQLFGEQHEYLYWREVWLDSAE